MIAFVFEGCINNSSAEQDVNNPIEIFNFDDKEALSKYGSLRLDSTHSNLLNPQIAVEDFKEVRNVWIKLHQDLNKYLSNNAFDWNSSDSSISILHKIYFQKDGKVKYHFFRVFNANVSENTKKEFSNLLSKFDSSYKINLQRDSAFAQCGKASYPNN